MLQGKKVILRPIKKSDLQFFMGWVNDLEIMQCVSRYMPMSEIAEEKKIEQMAASKQDVYLVIEAIQQDKVISIGICGLHRIDFKNQNATFGIVIGNKGYWGKGYGTEAAKLLLGYGFDQLNLHRVSSCVLSTNKRSLKMHLKVGFKEEGRSREVYFKNGKFDDQVILGLLRKEWKKRR